MATEAEILTKLNDLLDGIDSVLDGAGASKLVTLDRATPADAALVYLRENGDEKFRWGMPGGEHDFVIQHSPDGSPLTYADVFRIDGDTGLVTVTGLSLAGASIAGASFTGQSLFAGGSVAAPSIGFTGDPDTGLYSTGPNGMGIVSGGRLVMEIADDNVPVEFTMANGGLVQFSEYSVGASPRLIANADTTNGARAYFAMRHDNIEKTAFYTVWNSAANRADFVIRHTDPNGNIDLWVANAFAGRMTSTGRLVWGGSAADYHLHVVGDFGFQPGGSVTPVSNGDVVFEATDNSTITVKLRGSDGTVRSGTIALA